jgi:hypothetical protein
VGRTSTTNANTDVVGGEILASQLAHVSIEGGREQKIAMIAIFVGV